MSMQPPLAGLRVLEIGGIGPIPMAGMLLADLGAEVLRIDRPGDPSETDYLLRGRTQLFADLKNAAVREDMLALVAVADVLIEGFRPGVMERLGLGPDVSHIRNPGLIYGRMTGYGQKGPRSREAGHDINYISLTGTLHAMGADSAPPMPPLNLLGDFGGGAMFLVVGVLAALHERQRSGHGQVVDAAIVDGTSVLAQLIWSWRAQGRWQDRRANNLLDGAAPYYTTYACSDGRFIAVGALEQKFFDAFVTGLGLSSDELCDRDDPANWPALRDLFASVIASRDRDAWAAAFAGTDACVTPVLDFGEVIDDPHMRARDAVRVTVDGAVTAGTAPVFSRTPLRVPAPPHDDTRAIADFIAAWSI